MGRGGVDGRIILKCIFKKYDERNRHMKVVRLSALRTGHLSSFIQ